MRAARVAAAMLSSAMFCAGAGAQSFDEAAWARVLARHVTPDGRVDYAGLKARGADLRRVVGSIAARSPASDPAAFPTRNARMAYWINAYNALVMSGVAENWPVKSVRDIGLLPFSFFWRKKFKVGGRSMTLNDIEHGTLRKQFGDPRIHFALNCASIGCPLLRREPYRAATLDEQLDDAARKFLADPARGMRIDAARNTVWLSHIFKWYGGDFEAIERAHGWNGAGSPLLRFARRYANAAERGQMDGLKNPSVKFLEYDWSINAAAPAAN
jgi:Protein of unknown function, DUF547